MKKKPQLNALDLFKDENMALSLDRKVSVELIPGKIGHLTVHCASWEGVLVSVRWSKIA